MKAKIKSRGILVSILLPGLLMAQITFGQTNLQFTSVNVTDEGAIQLHFASQPNHLYEVDEADSLIDTNTGSTTWNKLYDDYPSQGTNTFIGDFGNYNIVPQILHPKNSPMRFYRILDEGQDSLASDEPTVSIISPSNSVAATGELTVTVVAATDQPVLSGTKLYVDGQEMQFADSVTNWTDGSTNYEMDTYSINTCEWLDGTHTLFAVAECESGYAAEPNSGAVMSGHGVSPFASILFSNLVEGISFSQPTFDPSSGQTQQVSAVFAANCDWTLNIVDVSSNVVQTASGSGTSMTYNWDGTSNGTNTPNGIYYYYIYAQTNGEADEIVGGGSGGSGGDNPPSPDFALFPELWTLSASGNNAVPLAIYPPGFDTNDLTIFSATPSEINAARVSVSRASFSSTDGGSFSPNDSGGGSSAASQGSPAAPQRPPSNPVKGLAGSFGIAFDTYNANGTNGVNTPALQNEPGLPGSYIQMESFSANSGLNWGPRPQHIAEASAFIKVMQHYGWAKLFYKADGQLNINDLRGSGTLFNTVNFGVLMLHGTYGNTLDYQAGLCKQMYFPVTSGGSAQYLRFSEMNLGGSGANGLKWIVLDPCNSLYHANWSSMQSRGIKPYNSNLHLILGANSETWTYPPKWQKFAQYMNYGTNTLTYNPLTIREAYYQGNHDAFAGINTQLPRGTTIILAVAGDSACMNDSLQTNYPPQGSWTYDSRTVFSN